MTSSAADVYAAEQQAAVMAAVVAAGTAAGMAGFQLANFTVFMRFLRAIWPVVLLARGRAAWSARNFFDVERRRVTGLPRLDVPLLPEYKFEWFAQSMKPAYQMAVKQIRAAREAEKRGIAVPAPKIESTVRVAVAKIVADAGREQAVEAVEADAKRAAEVKELREKRERGERVAQFDQDTVDELTQILSTPNLRDTRKEAAKAAKRFAKDLDADYPEVVGWARAATGDETCAWCMMLVSRGPVYLFADTAGAQMSDAEVVEALGEGMDIPMTEWHVGCDCTVVPVYDKDDWPGKRQADEALEAWKDAGADFLFDPDKKYRRGKPGTKDYEFVTVTEGEARFRETLNNLRFTLEGRDPATRQRRVSKGELDEILAAIPGAAKLFQKELARR